MGGRHQLRAMKDGLNKRAIRRLGENLSKAHTRFDVEGFVTAALQGIESLELKARVTHIATVMGEFLPEDRREAIRGLLSAIPHWDRGSADDNLRGFATWPVFVFVEMHGLDIGDYALRALGELTHLFTAEFSVRPFIEKNPEMAMAVIQEWTRHPKEDVRRLASEGIRPRLPWAGKLALFVQDPAPVVSVLDTLIDDDALYVRRSVANCLSDIAADHPDLAIATCKRWLAKPSTEGGLQNGRRAILLSRDIPKCGPCMGSPPSPMSRSLSCALTRRRSRWIRVFLFSSSLCPRHGSSSVSWSTLLCIT